MVLKCFSFNKHRDVPFQTVITNCKLNPLLLCLLCAGVSAILHRIIPNLWISVSFQLTARAERLCVMT